jgi:oxygen-independent coproporphyrinogen-3 oxidase
LHNHQFPVDFEEKLDPDAHRKELLVIQLRLCCGVSIIAFEQRHGALSQETARIFEHLKKEGFIASHGDVLTLTKKGILFYDTVASELI